MPISGKRGKKLLLLGNEAIARGALEAGMKLMACYPGTPSSEVADTLALMRTTESVPEFAMEYSVNEKVAMEVACGAALAGSPSLVAMKHVGLNVAADPLFTAAYIGLPGGMVILSADDPGCHSSQNEQDNRQYARFAGLPCFEPTSASEAKEMTKAAFEAARQLEQPVLLRTTTRISHMRGPVECDDFLEPSSVEFPRKGGRFVPVPATAIKRHPILAQQLKKAQTLAESSPFNRVIKTAKSARLGIIASGMARTYLHDSLLSLPKQDIDIVELGMTWPLPEIMLIDFLKNHDQILVLEEGAPLLENDIRALAQKTSSAADIQGKDSDLTEFGEFSTTLVKNRLMRWLKSPIQEEAPKIDKSLPGRPPNLCPGCAHRSVYYAVREFFGDDAIYSSDIGCYTLGVLPPLKTADFLVCMGSSVSAGSGFSRVSGNPVVAFIGDSTFFHSGMTGLANAVFNNHNLLLVILDNGTTAMTGHQPNPGMPPDLAGFDGKRLDLEKIIASLGVENMRRVRASNLKALREALRDLAPLDGVRVLLAQEPCMLFARRALKRKKTHVAKVKKQGPKLEKCLRELACPAFARVNGEVRVDERLCSGCMFCLQIAPEHFGAQKLQ